MGRTPRLEPRYDWTAKRWVLTIPATLSPTGKRRRERFEQREAAEGRARSLQALRTSHQETFAKHIRPDLIRDALECEQTASELGFDSLREAFMAMATDWEKRQRTMTLGALLDAYRADREANWSDGYRKNRWGSFRKLLASIESKPLGALDSDFWREWLARYRRQSKPAAATYNQTLGLLRSIFGHQKAIEILPQNPVEPIPNLKPEPRNVSILEPEHVAALLHWTHEHDPDLVPYIAIGCFAGLRPMSELRILKFQHLDLTERLIDVHTSKTIGTVPRRQVPMEPNLSEWLAPFARQRGPVFPATNFRRRFDAARAGAAETLGLDAFPWDTDIMRHSYGSYWDAAHRGEEGYVDQLIYQMGHTSRKTFERHYHNHRTRKQAAAYWDIRPPQQASIASIA